MFLNFIDLSFLFIYVWGCNFPKSFQTQREQDFNSQKYPWYFKTGQSYLRDESPGITDKYAYLNLRVGHDLLFFKRTSFRIDAGMMIESYYGKIENASYGSRDISLNHPVFPGWGFGFFYPF